MDRQTQRALSKADAKLDSLLAELEVLPEEVLKKTPAPGAWSVLDVMHHLQLAEYYSQAYVEKKLSFDPELKPTNLGSWFRSQLLNTYSRWPMKWKAPKGVDEHSFPQDSSLEEVAQKWKTQRAKLKSYLEELPEDLYKRQVYKHPFAGRLSLAGMVSFFNSHFDRHHRQIRRTLKAVQG